MVVVVIVEVIVDVEALVIAAVVVEVLEEDEEVDSVVGVAVLEDQGDPVVQEVLRWVEIGWEEIGEIEGIGLIRFSKVLDVYRRTNDCCQLVMVKWIESNF